MADTFNPFTGEIDFVGSASAGDITSVTAGLGLSGGGTSGDVTLTLDTAYTDTLYLRLDGSNDPVTGDVAFTGGLFTNQPTNQYISFGPASAGATGNPAYIFRQFSDSALYIHNVTGNLNLRAGASLSFRTTGNVEQFSISQTGGVVSNEQGNAVNFRVEGDTDQNVLFIRGSTDNVGIGTSTPNSSYKLDVNGSVNIAGDLTIVGDDLFMTTNTVDYFLVADGTNFNPTSPANARTSLGLIAGGTGDIWVEKAGDAMTGQLIIQPSTDTQALILLGNAAQSVNIQEWQDSSSNVLSAIDKDGDLLIGAGTFRTNLQLYNSNESTTLTNFTQNLTNAGINIQVDQTNLAYTSGIFWSTQNNNATKPKAGIWMRSTTTFGSYLYFAGSSNFATGIVNPSMIIGGPGDQVAIGNAVPDNAQLTSASASDVPAIVARASSGHTMNIQEWQDASTGVLAAIDKDGNFTDGGYKGDVVEALYGGTGFGTYAVGDILYANTTSTLAKLSDIATGNTLISGGVGVAPSWGKVGLTTHVSGTLPVANGGTAVAALSNVLGTTDQVSVSNGTGRVIGGNVTLSLPQNIASTSSPTFTGLTLSSTATITVATASVEALVLKTSDNNTTRNLLELRNSSNAVVTAFGPTGAGVVNEQGNATIWRVESDNNANMLYVDGPNDRVGMGVAPSVHLHLASSNNPHIWQTSTGSGQEIQLRMDNTVTGKELYLGLVASNNQLVNNSASGDVVLRADNANIYLTTDNGSNIALAVNTDGRVFGRFLHNVGTVTGTTNQYIASGTYTPSLTNVTNVAASTAYSCQWIRVGNVVIVSGKFDMDVTTAASTATEIAISLPIASNFTVEQNLGGTAVSDIIAGVAARIKADATNDRASVVLKATSASNDSYAFTFQYVVL